MNISGNFSGGNIVVKSIQGNIAYLECDLRGGEKWFYWAFCVEDAQSKTMEFVFENEEIGYMGPAISHDLKSWEWLGERKDRKKFSYNFGAEEKKVFFAHHMLYSPERFFEFAKKQSIAPTELCKSRKNRSVPCLKIGNGSKNVILTARHHACESTGSYVLEGLLERLIKKPIDDIKILCVPFVDYDGVIEGDQGKGRLPYDHNRDYIIGEESIYPETKAIREYADLNGVAFGFDFHSPYQFGGVNDKVFIVRKSIEKKNMLVAFGKLLEKNINEKAFKYSSENDFPANYLWNKIGTPCFGTYMLNNPKNCIAFTLETAYFGEPDNPFSQERAVELGRCFAEALRAFLSEID